MLQPDRTTTGEKHMSTTTIRLSDELKARIADAAKQEGTSAHNFILEAIAEKADAVERKAGFQAEAGRRYARFLETGASIPWAEMRRYLTERIHGNSGSRPVARKLVK